MESPLLRENPLSLGVVLPLPLLCRTLVRTRPACPSHFCRVSSSAVVVLFAFRKPCRYQVLHSTPHGHSANINTSTRGIPIYICYRKDVRACCSQ